MASATAVDRALPLGFENAFAGMSSQSEGTPEDTPILSAGSVPDQDSAGAKTRGAAAIPDEQSRRGRPRKEFPQRSEAPCLDARRQYNREYMRQWRADPKNQVRDHENRRACYFARKERNARREDTPYTDSHGNPVCGFCRKGRPQKEVLRLRVCDDEPSGYAEVRIPYCGKC